MQLESFVYTFLKKRAERSIKDLQEFIRRPSVVTDERGVCKCADWLAEFIERIGIPVEVLGSRRPVIFAQLEGDSERSLLIYGHYDVQPVDTKKWHFDPFGAEVSGGHLYGRGAVDNKGPVMAAIEAMRAHVEANVRPPLTVKLLLEGEEEAGSPSLMSVLKAHAKAIRSDAMVNFDDCVWEDGRPRIVCGVKGICMLRLTARTKREFHAMMAPLVQNAIWRLLNALYSLMDSEGNITIDGFFDSVLPPTKMEVDALRTMNWSGERLLSESGQKRFACGCGGLEALRKWLLEPTVNLQGICGGYLAPNSKGVVPAVATAELRFGTVPRQTSEEILNCVNQHLSNRGFDDIEVELIEGQPWARTRMDARIVQALKRSLHKAFGSDIVLQPTYAGSGPEGLFQMLFPEMEQAYSGFGPPENVLHAPNEYIPLDNYFAGIETIARLFWEYARTIHEERNCGKSSN